MVPAPVRLESPESASPFVTRAVAAGLRNAYTDSIQVSALEKIALRILGRLPAETGEKIFTRLYSTSMLEPGVVSQLTIEQLAQERLQDYAGLEGQCPAALLGPGLGGAAAHLSLAAGGPFLPQAFVVTVKGGAPGGDTKTYFQRGHELALDFARRNPGVLTIQHFDPVHDGWVTGGANHIRFKLLGLPQAYQDFLLQRIEPGGSVIYLNSRAEWLRYRVGERSVFQVGGWGDLSPEEYLEGSQRLEAYCREQGFPTSGWKLPGYELERGPESEWGSEGGLGEALHDFCETAGFQFVQINLDEPHDASRLAFFAVKELIERSGQQPAGAFIEMFTQYDATAVQRAGLLPVWLVFNTLDSLAFMKEMIPHFPPGKTVFFSPLATFSHTPDLVEWRGWENALQGIHWINAGARPSHYPADARALVDWAAPMRWWVEQHPQPIQGHLTAQEIAAVASRLPR